MTQLSGHKDQSGGGGGSSRAQLKLWLPPARTSSSKTERELQQKKSVRLGHWPAPARHFCHIVLGVSHSPVAGS